MFQDSFPRLLKDKLVSRMIGKKTVFQRKTNDYQ